MNNIISIIVLPAIVGLLLFLVPEKLRTLKGISALLVSLITGILTFLIYSFKDQITGLPDMLKGSWTALIDNGIIQDGKRYLTFNTDSLSKLIVLCISLFSFLILLYSIAYIKPGKAKHYYSWFLITISCAYGAVLSDNLILFLGFWGILGITLYMMIPGKDEDSSAAAKKTLILIGASDSIMIIGIAIIWRIAGSLSISDLSLGTDNIVSVVAFLALVIGSFTKAGAFPFHTWVPDYAKNAPASSSAYMPASLDKLLGIYFLARITNGIFIMNEWLRVLLLTLGVASIIVAVLMALVQHNYKKLLGFHAVSQVGYMIVGFGMGSIIGVAAGLFHMINHALYKSGLLLSAGCIEYRTGKDNIEDLGGLSKSMPVTFISSLVFAMSISGIPPLNGFSSKWMIYQGIIEFGTGTGIANQLWIVWLGLTVFGSALTLASFIKFIGGVFLGRKQPELKNIREVPFIMWLPVAILAFICVFFGIFATNLVIPKLITPVSGMFQLTGFWNSSLVSFLVIISILLGIILYLALDLRRFRREDSFIGGEKIQDENRYPVTEFYNTIKEFRIFSWMYSKAEDKWFDVYDLSKRSVLWLSHQFSEAHTGVLTGYVFWAVAGLIIMLLILI